MATGSMPVASALALFPSSQRSCSGQVATRWNTAGQVGRREDRLERRCWLRSADRHRPGTPLVIFPAMSTLPGLGDTHRLPVLARRIGGRAAAATIALSTALFLLANGVGLSDPGLQYDELLFVNAALGDTHPYHGFIYNEALGIPTMLMAYIGALKAWLYAPIFSIFG